MPGRQWGTAPFLQQRIRARRPRELGRRLREEEQARCICECVSFPRLGSEGDEQVGVVRYADCCLEDTRTYILIMPLLFVGVDTANSGEVLGPIPAQAGSRGRSVDTASPRSDAITFVEQGQRFVSNATCSAPQSYHGQITDGMVRAGFIQGGKVSCRGDSGGPLMAFDQQGGYALCGCRELAARMRAGIE
jgi:hypothetical protein